MNSTTAESLSLLERLWSLVTAPAPRQSARNSPGVIHGGNDEEPEELDLTIEQEAVYLALLHGAVPF